MLRKILPEEISQGRHSGDPGSIKELIVYLRRHHGAKNLKQKMFSFLPRLGDVDAVIRDFWDEYRGNLEPWYLAQKRPDDIIISASPEFLLRPICAELGVTLIGTSMDKETGLIDGENCHDAEKVRRFNAEFPDAHINSFYSDSLADTPMAKLADKAFLVKRGELSRGRINKITGKHTASHVYSMWSGVLSLPCNIFI